jgi:hypothetical protein
MLQIRQATALDRDAIWGIFHPVAAVAIPTLDPRISREDALAYWMHPANWCYVAEHQGNVVGTYILRSNQSGPGSHVANAAFLVSFCAWAWRRAQMGEHSLSEAGRPDFLVMQFNFVVSTNEPAVRLWQN